MKLPVTTWIVMMHHQVAGTFAPAFPTLDEAEEFSNAIRATTDGFAVSEPVPMAQTTPRSGSDGNSDGVLSALGSWSKFPN
jgi:hypothetical protein